MNAIHSRNLRILAADDNPVNQKLMIAALKSLGHTGVVVNDGEKALRALGQLQFDLVLLDVQMPVMDGLQVLAEIRAQEQAGKPHLPVIMVTANDLPGDRLRFTQKGADGYVAKPVDVEVLNKEITRVLGAV
ncbi:MAG: response regulator [Hylemonella sp.]|nr:response regulator [Hylemonella sp.]